MNRVGWRSLLVGGLFVALAVGSLWKKPDASRQVPAGRQAVVFWHFWGGADRRVVEDIVDRFNRSQDRHFVRAIAMPGANLDLKFFLAVTGGNPPDLINQDDPIVADWADRGAIVALDELATRSEMDQLHEWLFPAARRLGSWNDRLFALCNGLDIRALYYNQTMLEQYGLRAPQTLDELDAVAATIAPPRTVEKISTFGYVPDPRRLWAWGTVFGGRFYESESGRVTADSQAIERALQWMAGYRQRYGARNIAAFRHGDQSLPGKTFPLLAGRYAVVMDGQWRVRDIAAAQAAQRAAGRPVTMYGVCPLPPPPGGVANAGWVNGNFFLVPRGASNPPGAWEFMKFWSGFGGHERQAASACARGGWIPASPEVVREPEFQQFMRQNPLFRPFVALAASPHQIPTPVIPGAPYFYDQVVAAAETAMYQPDAASPKHLLDQVTQRVQSRVDASRENRHAKQ